MHNGGRYTMQLQFLSQQLEFRYCHVSLSAAYVCILFSGTQTDLKGLYKCGKTCQTFSQIYQTNSNLSCQSLTEHASNDPKWVLDP